jgi:hypothetical protein
MVETTSELFGFVNWSQCVAPNCKFSLVPQRSFQSPLTERHRTFRTSGRLLTVENRALARLTQGAVSFRVTQ